MKRPEPSEERRPIYPENLAFVIQIERSGTRAAQPRGRVEHVASGHAGRFEGAGQLMEFVVRVLARVESREELRESAPETTRLT